MSAFAVPPFFQGRLRLFASLLIDLYFIAGLLFFGWPASVVLVLLLMEEGVNAVFYWLKGMVIRARSGGSEKFLIPSNFLVILFFFFIHFCLAFGLVAFFGILYKDEFAFQFTVSVLGLIVGRHPQLEWEYGKILLQNLGFITASFAAAFWWQYLRKKAAPPATMAELYETASGPAFLSHFTVILGGFGLIVLRFPMGMAVGIILAKLAMELLYLPRKTGGIRGENPKPKKRLF